jgi:hypothetical protein
VGLGEDGAGEAVQGGGVGEDPDDVGAAFDLFVEAFQGVGRPDWGVSRFLDRGSAPERI